MTAEHNADYEVELLLSRKDLSASRFTIALFQAKFSEAMPGQIISLVLPVISCLVFGIIYPLQFPYTNEGSKDWFGARVRSRI